MSRIISRLNILLSEGETGEKIESYEDLIIEEIEKHVKELVSIVFRLKKSFESLKKAALIT